MKTSGAMNTDAILFTDCPKCKSNKTLSCRTPKGRKAEVHLERLIELKKVIGFDIENYTYPKKKDG